MSHDIDFQQNIVTLKNRKSARAHHLKQPQAAQVSDDNIT